MADKTITQLSKIGKASFNSSDELLVWDTSTGRTQKADVQTILERGREFNNGYFALLTNYYFTGGVATETEITIDDIGEFVPVNFTVDPQGTFDNRPLDMTEATATPFDVDQYFSLEGLTQNSSCTFRASMSFEPDEDEGALEARLNFRRHSGTTPSEDFQIADVALAMSQGADIEYPAEPTLTFFVGDTIDTNGAGDAGSCTFQVKSTVPGTVRMFALTWYVTP